MPEKTTTSPSPLTLEPGTLWAKLKERTENARLCGALLSIPTEFEFVEQEGIHFLVRSLSNLARKEAAKNQQDKNTDTSGKEFNPFLPYEEDLFVTNISETHLCLLNKFNVVAHHLLIVTREFADQESLLTLADFEAMWAVLAEMNGLAFYNGGKLAGASQRHKHLQVIPLPLSPGGLEIPIAPALAAASFQDCFGTVPVFQFAHALAKLNFSEGQSVSEVARSTFERYNILLKALNLSSDQPESGAKQAGAYNLLATREWMLIVPRSQEHFESIAVNSLGFAGTLFVRNSELLQVLKNCGPLTVLRNVAKPIAIDS